MIGVIAQSISNGVYDSTGGDGGPGNLIELATIFARLPFLIGRVAQGEAKKLIKPGRFIAIHAFAVSGCLLMILYGYAGQSTIRGDANQ